MIPRTGAFVVAASLVVSAALFSPALAHAEDESLQPEIVVDWQVTDDVGSEFHVTATVDNRTTSTYEQWTVEAPFRHAITQIEGAVSVQDESTLAITGTRPLSAGEKRLIEMSVTSTGPVSRIPTTCAVAQTDCRIVVPGDDLTSPGSASTTTSESVPTPSEESSTPGPIATPESDASEPARPGGEEPPPTNDSPDSVAGDPSGESGHDDPDGELGPEQYGLAQLETPNIQRLAISIATTSDWGSGQSVSATLRNDGPKTINEWSVTIPWEIAIDSMWNAESTSGGGVVRAASTEWNGLLEPGQAVQFGFNGSPGSTVATDGVCYGETDLGPVDCSIVP